MTLQNRVGLGLMLWFACEIAAFIAVVSQIGLGAAILVGILTSMIGASALKRVGTAALGRLRRETGSGVFRGELVLDDTLAAIGAVLLLLPGFASDAVGLVLCVPAARDGLARLIRGGTARGGQPDAPSAPRHGPATIDLDPEDWRPADDPEPRRMPGR